MVLAELPIQFDRPGWLLLLLLIVPVFLIAMRSVGGLGRIKATLSFACRTIIIFLLALSMAHPSLIRRGEGITTTIVLDRSQSVPLALKSSSLELLRRAADNDFRERDDRIAVITTARDARIAAMPDKYSAVTTGLDEGDLTATNLEAAVELALAIMPKDTANRILLVSDGNETVGNVENAARLAKANGVPIDVMVLRYQHQREVLFDRIIAPARARMGQSVNVRMVLRSQGTASGRVFLRMNGEALDLNGPAEGVGLDVTLEPGTRVIPVTLKLDDAGAQRFEATFEPASPADDAIDANNRAMAVTFVGSQGNILLVDDSDTETENLVRALYASGIGVERVTPVTMGYLLDLAEYDAVVLANVPRHAFDDEQVRDLHAYVHDLGGGLVMLGGTQSFGAGAWIDSDVARALPVRLDPPQSRQMPRGALALIMHSCEMAQGNYWGQKVAEAAITALSSLDYAGIVVFDWGGGGIGGIQGCSWAFPMQIVGDKRAAIAATQTMRVGDMPSFAPSMQLALNGLNSVNAGQKHAIIISDGDPSPPPQALLAQYQQSRVTVTTVMVGGHGTASDKAAMKGVADATGGRFYEPLNPKQLPQIFIKEAQLVSRSLIQEDDYSPVVISRLPGPTEGYSAVPGIRGYVLTAQRDGLAQTPIVNQTTEGDDPIYAHWNYGLGKSIAFTSDLTGRWGGQWVSWSEFRGFWEQSFRWVMRQSSPRNLLLDTRTEAGRAIVELESLDADAAFVNFMNINAIVLGPTGSREQLTMPQVGPGRYRGEFEVSDAGAYLVNVFYEGPSGNTVERGTIQAAVTVPYADEFRAVQHNGIKLANVAAMTQGRELSADAQPENIDLFARGSLPIPRSLRDVWDLVVIIAASLFLLDVATRRLSVDRVWLRATILRALGRREEVGSNTVAAWKRAKGQVMKTAVSASDQRQAAIRRDVKFEATEEDKSRAIDVGSETQTDIRDSSKPAQRAAPPKPAEKTDDDQPHTSRLLAAKRRALRDETGDQQGTQEGGIHPPHGKGRAADEQ